RQAHDRSGRKRARTSDAEFGGRGAEYRQRRSSDGERRHQGRGDLPPPVSRPRDHGADELHGSPAQGRLRNLGRQPGHGVGPSGGGEDRRPAVGQGHRPQPSDRRWLRPATGGRRCHVEIAQHVDGPVKVVWTREEDIQHDMYRPYWFDRLSAGLDAKGMPVAWNNRFAGSSVASRWASGWFKNGLDPDSTEGAIDLVYSLP